MIMSTRFLQKRILLPLASLLLLSVSGYVAVLRSNTSRIVVYNQTGAPIAALRAVACGQTNLFRNLAEEDSFGWKLSPTGDASDIELEMAVEPPWRWRGGFIQPRGGYRVTLRLWPDGEVEAHTQVSFWQRLVHGAPNINE